MSKKDFQNGFALGFASGGVIEIEKEEQEKTVDIIENGTTEVIPDEGRTLSKVTVNVAIESGSTEEADWNLILNTWGSDNYELDTLFYTSPNITSYGKFLGIKVINLFITTPMRIPDDCFGTGSINTVWLGSLDVNNPSSQPFTLGSGCFSGNWDLCNLIINSILPPLEAMVLITDSVFSNTGIEMGMGVIYVPENKVEEWQSAIDNFELTNFYYWVEVKPISSAFEEGGPLYGINLDNQ